MKVFRAHDGRAFEVNQPLSAFQSVDELQDALSLAASMPSDALICMTASGAQLSADVVSAIAREQEEREGKEGEGSGDLEFYVFNRDFLYAEFDELAEKLAEPLHLQPALPELELANPPTPRSLAQLLDWSTHLIGTLQAHTHDAQQLHAHLVAIQRSTCVALQNLVTHAESVRGSFAALEEGLEREMDRMGGLLQGHERDLKVLGMVHVNPRLLVADVGKAAPKERTLSSYVSASKMGAVFEACSKVYAELQHRLETLRAMAAQLGADTLDLRAEVEGTDVRPSTETLDEAQQALDRAETLHTYLVATCSPDEHGWPAADALGANDDALTQVERSAEELLLLDEVGRDDVRRLSADKNDMMSRAVHLLGDISSLQSDYADLGASVDALDAEVRSSKTDGFRHLARLKNMLWAYGATVVEVVRRREFARHFMTKAQGLAELMAKISAGERKRREEYRAEVLGQLPWEVKGLDEAPLSLEMSTSKAASGVAEMDREDIANLFALLDEIERSLMSETQVEEATSPLHEVKQALRQLLARLDEVDEEFARLVDVGLLKRARESEDEESEDEADDVSDASERRRRRRTVKRLQRGGGKAAAAAATAHVEQLQRELDEARRDAGERERRLAEAHDTSMAALKVEAAQLRAELRARTSELEEERAERNSTARAVEGLRADAETEAARRLNMEEELGRLRTDAENAHRAEAAARAEAHEESERAAELEAHLADVQAELEETKAARLDASNRIENLLGQGTTTERELGAAQEQINELHEQLTAARAETREAREALADAETARDKALRTYRAEVDGDRAILEENLRRREAELQRATRATEQAEAEMNAQKEAADTLRGQLRAADEAHEEMVRQAMDADVARRHAERMLVNIVGRARPLLAKTTQLRRFVRAMPNLSSSSKKDSAKVIEPARDSVDLQAEEAAETQRQAALDAFEADVTGASAEVVLEALRALDVGGAQPFAHDEARGKLESLSTLVRKWQKAYKSCADKLARANAAARERITFRNFAAGDLALFLPTRNTSTGVRPWAAFNISFPHYFLNARGALADQLRTKEWIVARITTIEERTASNEVGEDGENRNPFLLADGVSYYLLDVDVTNPAGSASGAAQSPASLRSRRSGSMPGLTSATSTDDVPSATPDVEASAASSVPGSAPELRRAGSYPAPSAARSISGVGINGSGARQMPPRAQRQASEGGRLFRASAAAAISEEAMPPPQSPDASPPNGPSTSAPGSSTQPIPVQAAQPASLTAIDTSSRATSPSGITRALRASSRASSPEASRYGLGSAGGRPWPIASSLGSRMSDKSAPEVAAPAFGKGKKRHIASDAPASEPASVATSSGSRAILNAASRSAAASSLVNAPNPFSQSPGPPSALGDGDYFTPRKRKPSTLGFEVAPLAAGGASPSLGASNEAGPSTPTPRGGVGGPTRSPSALSTRIKINANSLLLQHAGSGILTPASAARTPAPGSPSPALASASLTFARGETTSPASNVSGAYEVASSAGSSAGGSGFAARTQGATPSASSGVGAINAEFRTMTLGRQAGRRPSSVASPPSNRFSIFTLGRRGGAAAASAAAGVATDADAPAAGNAAFRRPSGGASGRRNTSNEFTHGAGAGDETFVGSEGSARSSGASEALRRLQAMRRESSIM